MDLNKVSIVILTPAYGGLVYVPYFLSMIKLDRLCNKLGIKVNFETCFNESLIQRARNNNVDTFLRKTEYTHALFVDADIEFDENEIIEMIRADKDVIGGLYPKKSINWNKIVDYINQDKTREITTSIIETVGKDYVLIHTNNEKINKDEDIIETKYVGTGMMLVKRKVFLDIMDEFPHDIYNAGGQMYYMFFNSELRYGVYLSEDYWFCDRWLQLGNKIYIKNFKSNHWGTCRF